MKSRVVRRRMPKRSGVTNRVATVASASTDNLLCPKCQKLLTDPDGMGLCTSCGYCRSLHENNAVLHAARRPRRDHFLKGLGQIFAVAPTALCIAAIIMAVIAPITLYADHILLPGSRERAYWGVGQMFFGALLALAGQAWAIALLKKRQDDAEWTDLFQPLHLWGQTLRRLPETSGPVGLGGSGALTVLMALVWIGGYSYWARVEPEDMTVAEAKLDDKPTAKQAAERKKEAEREQERAKVAHALSEKKPKSPTPAIRPEAPILGAGTAPSARLPTGEKAIGNILTPSSTVRRVDTRPTEKCVIVGFQPAKGDQPGSLVLATLRDGKLSYAGVVRDSSTNPQLLDRLAALSRSRPLIEAPNVKAVWVRPEVFCEVHQSGTDTKGEFVDPSFKAVLED